VILDDLHAAGRPSALLLRFAATARLSRVLLLAALQGGLILAQVQGDTRPLETALDTVLDLARLSNREVPADGDTSTP
jgi:hypothetical protein